MPLSRLFRLIGAMLALATTALVWHVATSEWDTHRRAERGLLAVNELALALVVTEMVSRERGPANGLLGENLPHPPPRSQALAEARQRTDQAFGRLRAALQTADPPVPTEVLSGLQAAQQALGLARAQVDQTAGLPRAQRPADQIRHSVQAMVAVVPMLAPVTSHLSARAQQALPALAGEVAGARLAAQLREYAGQLGSLFTAAMARQQAFNQADRQAIEQVRGRIAQLRFLLDLQLQTGPQPAPLVAARSAMERQYFGSTQDLLAQMLEGGEHGDFGLEPAGFAARYVPAMEAILKVRDALLDQARHIADLNRQSASQALIRVALGSGALLLLLASTLLLVHRRILRPLSGTVDTLHAMARGDLSRALPVPQAQDEIAEVIGAVRSVQALARARRQLEEERDQLIAQLREQSNTDFLTGLLNRRAFLDAAEAALAQAQRHGFELTMVLLDIDHFKQINDRHGHAAGDQAIVAVAMLLRQSLRQGDLAARFGGEEFVVLLSHCDRAQGLRYAERLRQTIVDHPLQTPDGQAVPLSASLGVSPLVADDPSQGLDKLLSSADLAMYRAKRGGRNRVCLAEAA